VTDLERPVNASGTWDAYIALVQQSALHAEAMAESLGLDTTALRCIGFISSEPGMTPGRLADLTGLTTGAVTGVLDRLERGGFIERSADPSDRRRTLVSVSHGSGPVAHAYDQLAAAIESVAGHLATAERARLVETLDRMREVVASDVARLRATSRGGMVGEVFSAPVGGVDRGRLIFRSGAPRLAIRAAPLGPTSEMRAVAELAHTALRLDGSAAEEELCRAEFEGPYPEITARKGEVTMAYKRRLDWRQRQATVGLSRVVPWVIDVSGGMSRFDADLRHVRLHELDVSGSTDEVSVRLGSPDGTSRLRLTGGMRDLLIEHPAGVPVRVSASGGVHEIRVGREVRRDVHGTIRLVTPGAERAPDRFEIDVSGGANSIRVATA
jgi:DNA-binding MarR family transcriptional regulator